MKSISVAELRQNPTAALAAVESGESYVVTRHRHPVARLIPIESGPVEIVPPRRLGGAQLAERTDLPHRTLAEVEALLEEMKEDR